MPKEPRAADSTSAWVTATLEALHEKSKRGGKLPPPRYSSAEALLAETVLDELDQENLPHEQDGSIDSEIHEDPPDGTAKAPRKKQQTLKKLEEQTKSFLPDVNKILESLRNTPDGFFSDFEKAKINAAFLRFKDRQGKEIDKDNLPAVLAILGYRVDVDKCREIADSISLVSMLEQRDFHAFMENYKESEQKRYKQIFDTFDVDKNGYLDEEEVVQYVYSLGFIPLRPMVQEAMALVDLHGSGELNFEESVLLMHVLKHSEGFTVAEVNEFTEVFKGFDPNSEKKSSFRVAPSRVADLLVQFFGPSVIHVARKMQSEALDRSEDGVKQDGVSFQEALLWARRVRDVIFEGYREEFDRFDEDASNSVDFNELKKLLSVLGHTLTKKALDELLAKAQRTAVLPAREEIVMDFDAFVNLMQCLSQTDGFTESELEEIDAAFKRFDADGSGDIDVVELADILRYMGYRPKMDDVRRLCAQVDTSGDGHLDRREFVAFMRLRRESELSVILSVFSEFANSEERIPQAKLEAVLRRISGVSDGEGGKEIEEAESADVPDVDVRDFLVLDDLDFDGLVEICRRMRDARALKLRRFAGYKDEEVQEFRQIFDNFDTKQTGSLTAATFAQVLSHLGFDTQTVQQQKELKDQIVAARAMAAADGLEGSDDPGINFWIMLKLLRLISRTKALTDENNLNDVIRESNFTTKEITEFQDVFDSCWNSNLVYEEADMRQATIKTLPVVAIMRLLRSMGLNLETRDRNELNEVFWEKTRGAPRADFLAFLRIMHWMLTRNFCGINDYAERQIGK
eukprot:TRINITY_DN18971_c0_g1_i1.p1 TRINITY_DN18971_c0_g1~~TRINITY_DN18971_c0_g1_i1.p1  ORF type:complete len:800 (-),score=172.45 TRINITY_DN18971_c0_g1_i1:66-2465(-)